MQNERLEIVADLVLHTDVSYFKGIGLVVSCNKIIPPEFKFPTKIASFFSQCTVLHFIFGAFEFLTEFIE